MDFEFFRVQEKRRNEKLIKEVSYDISLTIAYLSSPKEKITYKFWAKDEEKTKVLNSANIKTNELIELINTCDMVIGNSETFLLTPAII
jgi:hypothetical protein